MAAGHREFAAFVALGVGVSWLPVAAIFLEVPRLQRVLPEGLCLSSYLNVVVHAGVVALLPYLYAVRRGWAVQTAAVRGIIAVSVALSAAAAACWHRTAGGHSTALLAISFVGGASGSVSRVAVMPFMHRFHPRLISAVSAGQGLVGPLVAAIAALQHPAGAMRFTTSTYFATAALLGVVPVAAYALIESRGAGGSAPPPAPSPDPPLLSPAPPASPSARLALAAGMLAADTRELGPLAAGEACRDADGDADGDDGADDDGGAAPPVREWAAILGWTSLHCFGLLPSFLPFCAKGTSPGGGDGGEVLQWAGILGSLANVLGSLAVYAAPLGGWALRPLAAVFTALLAVVYSAAWPAAQARAWRGPAGPVALVASFCALKFIEHYVMTLIYYTVRGRSPAKDYARHATLIGTVERVLVTIGSASSLAAIRLVAAGSHC